MGRLARLAVQVACAATVFATSSVAHARVYPEPCAELMDANNAPISDPRLAHLIVAGTHVNVLVPPGYQHNHRRVYPVLYLFHGAFEDEDSWTTQTDLLSFTAALPDDQQAIIIMPDGGRLPAGRDWADGTHPQETYLIHTLIPWVDDHYRTFGDRAHRAAAGFSAGGLDSLLVAARYPDLFVATASFSGFLDNYSAVGQSIVEQFAEADGALCGDGNITDQNIWGDPVSHPMGWVGYDPIDLAHSMHDISIYIASSNGVPCPDQTNPDPFDIFAEQTAMSFAEEMDSALNGEHIPHVLRIRACGIHTAANGSQGIAEFWPQMDRAFGSCAPDHFDYRASTAQSSVWDWRINADPARAPEFLDITNASEDGLILTGSGTTSITTSPLFRVHESVTVLGAGNQAQLVRADDWGRLSFNVDLGRAHTLEEYTTAELAAAASNPHYFVTRQVQFHRGFDRGDCH